MISHDSFKQNLSIRTENQLVNPHTYPLGRFDFPLHSALHFLEMDGIKFGPEVDNFLFRKIEKPISISHMFSLDSFEGNPRKVTVNPNELTRVYHNKYKRFRPLHDVTKNVADGQTLLVFNYNPILLSYKYTRSLWTEYYKWMNVHKTMYDNIAYVSKYQQRHHFIFIDTPDVLPSLTSLKKYSENKMDAIGLTIFNSNALLYVLELYKWLNPATRANTIFAGLTKDMFSKIDFIFMDRTNWCSIQLDKLDDWTKGHATSVNSALDFHQLQKHLLGMFIALSETRSTVDTSVQQTENNPNIANDESTPPELDDENKVVNADLQKDEKEDTVIEYTDVDAVTTNTNLNETTDNTDNIIANLDNNLSQLEILEAKRLVEQEKNLTTGDLTSRKTSKGLIYIDKDLTPEESLKNEITALSQIGTMSIAQYNRLMNLATQHTKIKSPYDSSKTMVEHSVVSKEELAVTPYAVKDMYTVPDKSMLESTLIEFDNKYINNTLPKHTEAMVLSIQKTGVIVTDYQVEQIQELLGDYEVHTIKLQPIEGLPSTLRFKTPKITPDGYLIANGNKYRQRRQFIEMPIRKINPYKVALTSYYGKTFIQRNQRRVNNYEAWLQAEIMLRGLDVADNSVTELQPANVFFNTLKLPRDYQILSKNFKQFKTSRFTFILDRREIEQYFKDDIKQYENSKFKLVGVTKQNTPLVMDFNNIVYEHVNGDLVEKGTIPNMVGLDPNKEPNEYAEVNIMGELIPVGVVLAYQLGLSGLMEILKVSPRRVPIGQRVNLDTDEFQLVFSDETLVFSKNDKLASMILNGFNAYKNVIKNYPSHTFDKGHVYLNIIESSGLKARYLREIDLMSKAFVDPITKDILIDMKEPTTFRGLLFRASALLLSEQHPDQLDKAYMRVRGYERVPGAIYSELMRAIRNHNSKIGKINQKIEMKQFAIWQAITQDSANNMVVDINPIENLKGIEAITFNGTGGRSNRSMTKETREYHRSDMGLVSESTVDSGDVGINVFSSANPLFNSTLGTTTPFDVDSSGNSSLLSTSGLLCVGTTNDDPKRTNFTAIQYSHAIACAGYHQPFVRTGYEQIIAHRTTDLYAYTAKQNGEIVKVNKHGIYIKYEDGSTKGVELGTRFGSAAGLTIPHTVTTTLKAGDKFQKDDVIAYNTGWFEPDILNPKNVAFKSSLVVKVVLWESSGTHEDSSEISERLAMKLSTQTTKIKTIQVKFDQQVRNMVKEQQQVDPETILCIIEDAITSNNNLFNEQSIDTLRVLSAQTPTAKAKGIIERIEVFYHGDKEDMSESLLELVEESDRQIAARSVAVGKPAFDGSVTTDFRVEGTPLELDTAAIRVYINTSVGAGVGDKGVFANQLKTVFGKVYKNEIRTEDGTVIDAVFGGKSIQARIVRNPEMIGTTYTLLKVLAKKMVKAYRGESS